MFLIDTVVISELRKSRPSASVVRWFRRQRDSDLFLSVVTLGEIERGIEKKRRTDPAFSAELSVWLESLVNVYGDRVLPVSQAVARRWGRLSAQYGNESVDLLIAATALTHGLAVVTRNVSDFAIIDVGVIDPYTFS